MGLDEVWSVPLERCMPVRRFVSRKGQRHVSGRGGRRPRAAMCGSSHGWNRSPDGAGFRRGGRAPVLRPVGAKAVDAALLLARMLVPGPMRPGWSVALRMAASLLPHVRLLDIDARMELAAARPVIVPDNDRVRRREGVHLRPVHPRA
jgi:hypothetical protein